MTARAWFDPARNTWVAIYSVPGRKHPKKEYGFKTMKAARAHANDREASYRHGTGTDPDTARSTLASFAPAWLDGYSKGRWTTYRQREYAWRVHIEPAFGAALPAQLTAPHIERFLDGLTLRDGVSPASDSTRKNVRDSFGNLLDECRRRGAIAVNPMHGNGDRRRDDGALDDDDEREMIVPLTYAQVEAWINEVPDRYRIVLFLAAFAGMRSAEARGLRPSDVHFLDGRYIDLRVQLNPKNELAVPKSKSSRRRLPAPDLLLDRLGAHLARWPVAAGEPIATNNVGRRVDASALARKTAPAAARAGLPAGTSLHDLRHFYASSLIAYGFSLTEVSKLLGHADSRVTERLYVHLMPVTEDRARAAIEAAIQNAPQTRRNTGLASV